MLIIASDIHLGDGTCARSISPDAFHLFARRLQELAWHASFTEDGSYAPVDCIDVALLGDILDPLHSTRWLESPLRPWSDTRQPEYAQKLAQITHAILKENDESTAVLRDIAAGKVVSLPPASHGRPDESARERLSPRVNLHYLCGNHDWYYHLPGPDFDAIRQQVIDALGLSNPADTFPWELAEHEPLQEVFARCNVYAQHGDKYDQFNYDPLRGRNSSSLGDVFVVELINRYPQAVMQELGDEIPAPLAESLRELTNVRPALAASLWITSQLRLYTHQGALEDKLKQIWDRLSDELLQVDFLRESDKAFRFDVVDALRLVVGISRRTSFKTLNAVVGWMRNRMWGDEISFSAHALREPAFLDGSARHVVYGHTHHHEVIPLDADGEPPRVQGKMYFNTGTWHSYFNLALGSPASLKFVPTQAMTYLTFYDPDERGERHFEVWSGAFS